MCKIKHKSWLEILGHGTGLLVLGLPSLDFGYWVLGHAETNENSNKSVNQRFREEKNCGVWFEKLMLFVSSIHSC